MDERFNYYHLNGRKFKIEKITETLYEVTMFNKGKSGVTWCFSEYASALEHILSYAEISE